jgi:hypothetical protein
MISMDIHGMDARLICLLDADMRSLLDKYYEKHKSTCKSRWGSGCFRQFCYVYSIQVQQYSRLLASVLCRSLEDLDGTTIKTLTSR